MKPLSKANFETLSGFPTGYYTDIYRAWGMRGVVEGLKPTDPSRHGIVSGRALTARFMPVRGRSASGSKLYDAIYSGEPGDVLVIEAPYPEVVVGDLVTACAHAAGFVGILVDGFTRDAEALCEAPVPVWSRGGGIARPGGYELQSIGGPVVCGGAQIHTGDAIVADRDGAIVIPPEEFEALAVALPRMRELEQQLEAAIARRVPLGEIHELFGKKAAI